MDFKSILPFLGLCSACFLLVGLWFFLRPLIKRYYYTKPAKDEPIEFYEHKRGIARYRRMRKQLNKAQDSELYRYLGIAPLPDSYSAAPEKYEALASQAHSDDRLRFYCYTKLAEDAFRENDFQQAIRFYKLTLSVQPHSIISSRIATVFERMGDAEHAIEYYERAAKEEPNTQHLEDFFASQAMRVKNKGCAELRPRPLY